jgi:SAM-dependent methyltransferase
MWEPDRGKRGQCFGKMISFLALKLNVTVRCHSKVKNIMEKPRTGSEDSLPYHKSRRGVWREIVRYVRKDTGDVGILVELGTGYCDFINQFPAKRKIGYDIRHQVLKFAEAGVDIRTESAAELSGIENDSVDLVFASNFMEHLWPEEHDVLLPRISDVLRHRGRLILIQPNYLLNPEHYFDDETHRTIFSDENIIPFLEGYGLRVLRLIPKFLPFSMKSSLPKWPFLVRLYLNSPVKPLAGQMYVVAAKGKSKNVER